MEMKLRAEEGESRAAISAMSAPPMNDLEPAPVRMTARRSLLADMEFRVEWRDVRRGVFRAFSLEGREIVMWAIVPVLRRVMAFRIWGVILEVIEGGLDWDEGLDGTIEGWMFMAWSTENHRRTRGRPRKASGLSSFIVECAY
jgi:hypothetical protein